MLYQIAKRDGFKYKIMFSLSFLFLIFQSLTLVFLENQFNFFVLQCMVKIFYHNHLQNMPSEKFILHGQPIWYRGPIHISDHNSSFLIIKDYVFPHFSYSFK